MIHGLIFCCLDPLRSWHPRRCWHPKARSYRPTSRSLQPVAIYWVIFRRSWLPSVLLSPLQLTFLRATGPGPCCTSLCWCVSHCTVLDQNLTPGTPSKVGHFFGGTLRCPKFDPGPDHIKPCSEPSPQWASSFAKRHQKASGNYRSSSAAIPLETWDHLVASGCFASDNWTIKPHCKHQSHENWWFPNVSHGVPMVSPCFPPKWPASPLTWHTGHSALAWAAWNGSCHSCSRPWPVL